MAADTNYSTIADDGKDFGSLFDWLEYTVFGATLFLSVIVGVYYGFIAKKRQNTVEGLILGHKQITLFPMATSLVASFISGIALLGLGSEAYTYGTQYMMSNVSFILVGVINCQFFLPVFYKLQVVSVYEYLEARFDHRIRKCGSLVFAFYLITYIPIVIYAPALALNQVAKINIHLITPTVCAVCIFYTSVGGLKAVVWTDVLQTSIMVGAMLTVVFIGLDAGGGLSQVATIVNAGGRWEWFNLDPSPAVRMNFWNTMFGMLVHWVGETSCNPSFVQRLVALKSLNDAKKAIVVLTFGSIFFRIISTATGLLAYAKYSGCDPISTKEVTKQDQIAPYYVLHVAGHFRGLPGVYLSGIFAAALSSMSGGLNTISATIYKDLMLPFYKTPPSDEKASKMMKILSVLFGILCVLLIFLVEKLGTIIELTNSLGGTSSGLLLGIFFLGLFIPFGNTKGAACGFSAGCAMMIWVIAGNRYARMNKLLYDPIKPMSVAECPMNITSPFGSYSPPTDDVFILYKMSFLYHSPTVFLTTLLVGMAVSYFTGGNQGKSLDPNLFSPFVHRFLDLQPSPEEQEGYKAVPLREMNSGKEVVSDKETATDEII